MDFYLDDDQLALQDSVARYGRGRWPIERVGERTNGAFDRAALDRTAWDELVALGVTAVTVDEARGGLGLGEVEAAVVFEQLGRHLAPGPLLWSALAAPLLPEVATGAQVASGVEDGGERPLVVEHAACADVVLVLRPHEIARLDRAQLPRGVDGDPLDPLSTVRVYDALPSGAPIGDAAQAAELRRRGAVLAAALQLGIAGAALDLAVAYAREREQFGAPIGSFQAVKHLLADMYVRAGLARSATFAAAAVLDDSRIGDAERAASAAKLLAGEAAVENARTAIQVYGGMGFTWEMPPQFLLKRALVLDACFGTPAAHALALGDALGAEAGAARATEAGHAQEAGGA